MNKEPETYEELIRQHRCLNLTKIYNLTSEQLNQIYNFLATNPDGKIKGDRNHLSLLVGKQVVSLITCECVDVTVDGVDLSNNSFSIINYYTSSSNGSYSGGSSSNNNNNNNHNNNNNNR